jgi:YggT family protein
LANCGHLGFGRGAVKDAPPLNGVARSGVPPGTTPFRPARKTLCVFRAAPPEISMENPFLWLIDTIITLYIWILIAAAILSWLIAFNVVNTRNHFVASVANFFYHATEPALRPIRAMLPNLGGIDISPVVLIIGLLFLERIIFWAYLRVLS